MRTGELPLERPHPQRQQPQDADRHVRAVRPRQHEERAAEQVRLERQALVHELRELDHLAAQRSEEHTSELQSQSNLVCRLLLEKKKKHNKIEVHSAVSILCVETLMRSSGHSYF